MIEWRDVAVAVFGLFSATAAPGLLWIFKQAHTRLLSLEQGIHAEFGKIREEMKTDRHGMRADFQERFGRLDLRMLEIERSLASIRTELGVATTEIDRLRAAREGHNA